MQCTAITAMSKSVPLLTRGIDLPSVFLSTPHLLHVTMAQFNSSNVIIQGGIFSSGQGGLTINNGDPEYGMHDFISVLKRILIDDYEGLHTLRLGVSLGAVHDSSERFPPPNCHPDTRKAVREIILDWIHSESSTSSFFWLYGSAGAGKTAILQAIAEFLCSTPESDENFGGSLFFF